MNLAVVYPWALTALALALLPLFNNGVSSHRYPDASVLPDDRLSELYSLLLKLVATAAMASLILGMAGLYRSEQWVERVGRGANIVMLFDRSSSMDHTFAGQAPGGGEESKASAAKHLLMELIKRRKNDRIGVAAYSTSPLYVMPLTENKEAVAAAISATDTPGLAYTNISKGLAMALSFFQEQTPESGSKIILLVSDGAAAIDADSERKLRQWIARQPIRLYWIFLRGKNNPGIFDKPEDPRDDNAQARPERYLHLFFKSLGIPYRAYQAESPSALQQAVAEIDRLENKPLHYRENIPREDLSGVCYAAAALLLSLLLGLKLCEARP
ncbi:vWA domain-containing protein [Methylomarinum sp. Ch1-1]|uniref:VWA domain-containing protein n=1 Tax=Methylomarinum roseum TaxID=3067653 RepID=A0AAU7P047_9GAMM|nr:vWA domain-containing protein [Methylomarinum sp. Ch1-1]MDP4521720.1 vWA domain-containing protein [Methylomarinum sp. Ch1-1]